MIDELQSVLIEYACLERVIDGYNSTLAKLEERRREVLEKLEKLKPSPEAPERYKEVYNKIMDKIDRIQGCRME